MAEPPTSDLSRQSSLAPSPENAEGKGASRTKAAVRVSRACVQCRSKHVKCDGSMPACARCCAESRPCYYARSRRGIRDPKKRSLISDKPPVQPLGASQHIFSPGPSSINLPDPYVDHMHNASNTHAGDSPSSFTDSGSILIDAYFSYFHPAHSFLLPKHYFLKHMEAEPDSMHFLLSVINFVGSLYISGVSSDELREVAFAAACAPLPMTPQSVQGLIILSIAALGEMKFEYQNWWTDSAISMARDLGMHRRTFADTTPDAVLAESYRRVYWGLFLLDCVRNLRDCANGMSLDERTGDVDLPCEEWEYESGQIPQPISLAQYDVQNHLGSGEFSSWAYLVDMCRISSNLLLPYYDANEEKKLELFERADALIWDWLIRVPQWKMELVDSGGVADMILFLAIALAQQNRLRIRQCASRQGLNLRQCFPLGPARGPHRQAEKIKAFGWNALPVDVQAANSVCGLFRQSFPIKNMSPIFLPGLLRVALAYLDACVFLGLDKPAFREKLNMLLHIMKIHGETWTVSQSIAEEVRDVATEYGLLPPEQNSQLPQQPPTPRDNNTMAANNIWIPDLSADIMCTSTSATMAGLDLPLYAEYGQMDNWAAQFSGHSINV